MSDFYAEWERPEFDSVPTLAENAVWRLPGCDDTVLRKLLQESYRDFCRRSAALRTWRKIRLEPNETHYPIAPLLAGEIDCVTQVIWAGRRVPVRRWMVTGDVPPMLELPHAYVGRHCVEETTDGRQWCVMVEAIEIPNISEERAPKTFLRRYGDAIIDGALARMFSMQGRAWTDAEQARQHAVAYENAISEARIRGMQGGPAANAGKMNALDLSGMV